MANRQSNSTPVEPSSNIVELDRHATERDLKPDTRYKGEINNTVDYGVFVSLRDYPNEISGLVHVTNLPPKTNLADYSVGDKMVVELHERKPNGDISFTGVYAPEISPDDFPEEGITVSASEFSSSIGQKDKEVRDQLNDIQTQLDQLDTQPSGTLGLIQNPIRDAVETLSALNRNGYATTSYDTQVSNSGETIEVSLTLSKEQ